ncbi:unnamed protein product [Ceutorhynchus assimilis]|uniref:Uncharacterized protein n=1 Tax=Ceutorhynchus assimilis TaxID=467358 RepID=A0A9P0DM51_9CUCU|nr:unnamed protein product [Ceutorhynchus assimilis]
MLLIVFGCLLAAAMAAPQNFYRQPQYQQRQQVYSNQPAVPIVSESNEINPDGSFSYSYVSGDGAQAQAQGYLKNQGQKDNEAEVIQGSYSYTAPDGTPITVNWIADENGFRAEGAHIPTPPPIPVEIQRSLDLIARQPAQVPVQYNRPAAGGFSAQRRYNRF